MAIECPMHEYFGSRSPKVGDRDDDQACKLTFFKNKYNDLDRAAVAITQPLRYLRSTRADRCCIQADLVSMTMLMYAIFIVLKRYRIYSKWAKLRIPRSHAFHFGCVKTRVSSMTTYGNLILDAGDVEEGLDLLPQFVPWPGAELEVFAQVPLADLESNTLFLQLLEFLPGEVTSDPGLHPGYDLAQPVVTQFFHLTQDTGAEEYLHVCKASLVTVCVVVRGTLSEHAIGR